MLMQAACGGGGGGGSSAPVPDLRLSTRTLSFDGTAGGADPAVSTVTVSSSSGALVRPTATVTSGAPWLSATVSGSSSPYTIAVQPTISGLAAGSYSGTISVASTGASASPQEIAVTLSLAQPSVQNTVRRVDRYWLEDGSVLTVPAEDVAAVWVATADGLARHELRPSSAGTWSGSVPVTGDHWIVVEWMDGTSTHYSAVATTLDLGRDLAGRPGWSPAAQGTSVQLLLGGVEPWSPETDVLQLFSHDAAMAAQLGPALPDGATSGALDVDLGAESLPPLLATDALWVLQGRYLPLPGAPDDWYLSYLAASSLTGVVTAAGALTPVAVGNLSAGASSATVHLDWRTSQFEAGLSGLDTASPPSHFAWVSGHPAPPGGPGVLLADTPMDLAYLSLPAPRGDGDLGDLSWGGFLPSGYGACFSVGYTGTQARAAPGAAPAALPAHVLARWEASFAPTPVAPAITSVRDVNAGGLDLLSAARTGVGLRPALSWTSPSTGTPSSYRLRFVELVPESGRTAVQPVAEAVVYSPAFTVPPGVLRSGHTYTLGVEALDTPTDGARSQPHRIALPRHAALTWTKPFSP